MDILTLVRIAKYIPLFVIVFALYEVLTIGIDNKNKFVALSENAIDAAIGKSKNSYFSRDRIDGFLSKTGVLYRRNDYNLNASAFIFEKIVISLLLIVLSFLIVPGLFGKLGCAVVMGFFGFMLPDIAAIKKNRKDNDDIQDDIISIYNILKSHSKAGVYVSDSLIECQRAVSNGRIKAALTELNNNILSRNITIKEAVDQFNARFDNDQIDNLSVILKQSLTTGQIYDILRDISKQIEDINRLRTESEKARTKRQLKLMNVTFFVMVSVLALYITGYQLVTSLSGIMD